MKIGKRKMSFLGLIAWVGALVFWFGGPFYVIRKYYYITDPDAMYDIMGKTLIGFVAFALVVYLLIQALSSPPGQFRNGMFALIILALIGGSATLINMARDYTGDLEHVLWLMFKYEAIGFGINAGGLFIDYKVYGDD